MRNLNSKRYSHLQEISAHEVGRPHFRLHNMLAAGLGDFVVQPEWDYYGVAVSTATVAQTLFAQPQGLPFTITGGATFIKTLQTTSMVQMAQLQAPERMLVRGLTLFTDNSTNQLDLARFLSQTIVNFFISTKSFFAINLAGKLPAGGGAWCQQSGTSAAPIGVTGNGMPSEHQGFRLTDPGVTGTPGVDQFPEVDGILIAQQQAFKVVVDPTQAAHINAAGVGFTTQAVGAVPAGIGINAWVILEGQKARAVL